MISPHMELRLPSHLTSENQQSLRTTDILGWKEGRRYVAQEEEREIAEAGVSVVNIGENIDKF